MAGFRNKLSQKDWVASGSDSVRIPQRSTGLQAIDIYIKGTAANAGTTPEEASYFAAIKTLEILGDGDVIHRFRNNDYSMNAYAHLLLTDSKPPVIHGASVAPICGFRIPVGIRSGEFEKLEMTYDYGSLVDIDDTATFALTNCTIQAQAIHGKVDQSLRSVFLEESALNGDGQIALPKLGLLKALIAVLSDRADALSTIKLEQGNRVYINSQFEQMKVDTLVQSEQDYHETVAEGWSDFEGWHMGTLGILLDDLPATTKDSTIYFRPTTTAAKNLGVWALYGQSPPVEKVA